MRKREKQDEQADLAAQAVIAAFSTSKFQNIEHDN